MSTVIEVDDVWKKYRLGIIGTGTLRHDFERWWHRVRGKPDPHSKLDQRTKAENRKTKVESPNGESDGDLGDDEMWALRGVSFEVKHGEILGIIGRNGAGKSTLLKILSRVTAPTSGEARVKGRIASLLEVGTGFHPELTGRENVFLNGAILGMTKAEIRKKFDGIVDFAGVERYMDTPVKRYSSGMYVRLAFAVAAHLEPEILIVDEVLAVGDAAFQSKCLGKMEDVSRHGRTVLFVSHGLGAIRQLCSRVALLSNGTLAKIGPTDEVADYYLASISATKTRKERTDETLGKDMFVTRACAANSFGELKSHFNHKEAILLSVEITVRKWVKNAELAFCVTDQRSRRVFTSITELSERHVKDGRSYATATIPPNLLVPGKYSFHISIFIFGVWLDVLEDEVQIDVLDAGSRFSIYEGVDYGCVFADCKWELSKEPLCGRTRTLETVI